MVKLITGLTQNTWRQSGNTQLTGRGGDRAGNTTPAHGHNKQNHTEWTENTANESSARQSGYTPCT